MTRQSNSWIFVCAMAALLALSATRGDNSASSERSDDDDDDNDDGAIILPTNQCVFQQPECGLCGDPIDVTLIARNDLVEPTFELTVDIKRQRQRELLSFLEQAAEQEPLFRFKSTYYRGLGYYIDTINGVTGSVANETFWHITSLSDVGSLQCGPSSYVPTHGETVMFNFTTYAQAFPDGHS